MTSQELAEFIQTAISTFTDVELLGAGKAYHYTNHAAAIVQSGRFLGAPIDAELDKTQNHLVSPPATADPGVVFAYEQFEVAKEEGFGCKIIEVNFSSAVRATHVQEAELDAPPAVLILNTEIASFNLMAAG